VAVKVFVRIVARLAVVVLVSALLVVSSRDVVVASEIVVPKWAEEVGGPVERETVFALPFAAEHVALHWPGHHDAAVSVALSWDGQTFEAPVPVLRDEVGEHHPNGETYGALIAAGGATHLRVSSDRSMGRVTVLALVDGQPQVVKKQVPGQQAGAVAQPAVTSRAGWGADESLRFRGKRETWPPVFHRVQKLVVHHTATSNTYSPQQAASEIRSIYYYHAVTQGWGDIGYNFLVDQFGTLYEGRWSRPYAAGEAPTGEDADGRVVTAGHTYEYNTGTVGVALLGTFTQDPPPPVAQATLSDFLAWESERHHLNLAGSSEYRNVVNDKVKTIENLAGHGNYVATQCPGVIEGLLAGLRGVGTTTPDTTPPGPPVSASAAGSRRAITITWDPSPETWSAGSSGVAYYEIQRSATPDGPFTAIDHTGDQTRTYTDSGVKGQYSYRVIAVDGAANSGDPSPVASARAT
jgi:hypothetical protein